MLITVNGPIDGYKKFFAQGTLVNHKFFECYILAENKLKAEKLLRLNLPVDQIASLEEKILI